MGGLFPGLLFLLVVFMFGGARRYHRQRDMRARLGEHAQEVGLEPVDPEDGSEPDLYAGAWDGRSVHVRRLAGGRWRDMRLQLVVFGVLPGVSARGLGDERWPRRAAELPLLDPGFDRAVAVGSLDLGVLEQLHARAREVLPAFLAQGWRLVDGDAVIELRWSGGEPFSFTPWRMSVRRFVEGTGDRPGGLTAWLAGERRALVRRRALTALAAFSADHARRRLSTSALADPDPVNASLAAVMLGVGAAWDRQPEAVQRDATRLAPDHVIALHRARQDLEALWRLARRGEERVALLALGAIGAIGTREQVMKLTIIAEASDVSRPVARRAREAIAAIQERLSGAEQGQLALLEQSAEVGQVSVAAEGGGLAVTDVGRLTVVDRGER